MIASFWIELFVPIVFYL